MALQAGSLANEMKSFIKQVNKMKQEDANKAIDTYCTKLEKVVYDAIKSITITIPPGAIQVQGSPSAQTNIATIVINEVVS